MAAPSAATAESTQETGAPSSGQGVKRPREEADDDDGKARIFGPYQEQPPTFKFMAPKALANTLLTCVPAIEEAAGGGFSMTEEGDHFPGTQCRVCSLQSPTDQGLQAGMKRILSIALQSGDCITTPNGDYQFICVLPAKSVAMMLGPKGANMKQLEGESGVHVHIEGDALGYSTGLGPSLDRKCTLKGTAASIERALPRMVDCTVSFKDHPWYPKWACRTSAERAEMYVAGEPVSRMGKLGLRLVEAPPPRVPRVVLPPGRGPEGIAGACAGTGPRVVLPPGQSLEGEACLGAGGGSGCMGLAGSLGGTMVGTTGGSMAVGMAGGMGCGMDGGMAGGMGCMGGGMGAGATGMMNAGGMGGDMGMGQMAMMNPMMASMMANMGMMAMCGGMGMVPMGMMNPMMMMNPMACMAMGGMMPAAMMAAMAGAGEGGAEGAGGGAEGGAG